MKSIISFLLLFAAQGAFANIEVTCFEDDCLGVGWEIYNWNTGEMGQVVCTGNSCEESGWVEYDHYGRPRYEAECVGRGCFLDGFDGYAGRGYQRLVLQSSCLALRGEHSDCLTAGWTIQSQFGTDEARCINDNCRENGWNLWTNRGRIPVRCKAKGCFTEGWRF